MARILIVDDDPAIRRSLSVELRAAGHEVATAEDGEQAEAVAETTEFDLIVTDLAMPVTDGFALIAAVRRRSKTPIIVLSVREQEKAKVRALDLGADDYVTKPFSVPELLARIRAQLRRSAGQDSSSLLKFPGLSIDFERRRVVQNEREIRLTPTEFSLLELFARSAGRPVTIDRIIARVWNGEPGTSREAVRVHVSSLRRKLEPDPSNPRYLVTEPWIGYRFIAEPL
ncbi:MAG TPA: response regulator transcription factor [Candidatus Polarisedimenticolia bacterium]|nr:response regulator transcription factor [Candidatus Polarisedimenticolia bacterium]